MRYHIYRATIADGATVVSKIEQFASGAWQQTSLSANQGKHLIPLKDAATVVARFPATLDGTNLRFLTTYDPAVATAEAGGVDDAALELTGIDNWLGKDRTCPAELVTRLWFAPSLTDSSGTPVAQNQDTVIVFELKAPTGPNR